jgi:hypothetical protein
LFYLSGGVENCRGSPYMVCVIMLLKKDNLFVVVSKVEIMCKVQQCFLYLPNSLTRLSIRTIMFMASNLDNWIESVLLMLLGKRITESLCCNVMCRNDNLLYRCR